MYHTFWLAVQLPALATSDVSHILIGSSVTCTGYFWCVTRFDWQFSYLHYFFCVTHFDWQFSYVHSLLLMCHTFWLAVQLPTLTTSEVSHILTGCLGTSTAFNCVWVKFTTTTVPASCFPMTILTSSFVALGMAFGYISAPATFQQTGRLACSSYGCVKYPDVSHILTGCSATYTVFHGVWVMVGTTHSYLYRQTTILQPHYDKIFI